MVYYPKNRNYFYHYLGGSDHKVIKITFFEAFPITFWGGLKMIFKQF